MQPHPAMPEVSPRRRDLPTPRALFVLPDISDEDLLRFGGLDPTVRLGVQRELELLVAPVVPLLAELVLAALGSTLGTIVARLVRPDIATDLAFAAMALAGLVLAASHVVALAWIARWARGHRAAPLVFLGGLALVATPRVLGGISGSPLVGVAAALAVVVGYPFARSIASGRYCLARLVACERAAAVFDADPFTFDVRVLFGLGWVLLPAVWLVRFLSRPFILPSDSRDRARMIWPEHE